MKIALKNADCNNRSDFQQINIKALKSVDLSPLKLCKKVNYELSVYNQIQVTVKLKQLVLV